MAASTDSKKYLESTAHCKPRARIACHIDATLARIRGLLMVASLFACVAAADENRVVTSPQKLVAAVPIVGVLPAQVPLEGKETAKVARAIEEQIAAALRARGFKVEDAQAYRALELEQARKVGGAYDPYSGRLKRSTQDQIGTQATQEFRQRHGLRGYARIRIERHSVDYEHSDRVTWNGVEENIVIAERPTDFIERALQTRDGGTTNVLSLKLEILDLNMERAYEGAGGVGAASAVVNGEFAEVDVAAVLTDTGRVQRAIEVALWPLAHGDEKASAIVQFQGATPGRRNHGTLPVQRDPTPTPSKLPAEIKSSVQVIAFATLDTKGHPQSDLVRDRYQAELARVLTAAGFRTVASDAYTGAVAAAKREVGATYDPITGEEIAEKRERFRDAVRHRLADAKVDGILKTSFEVRRAPYDASGLAHWDGVTERAQETPAKGGASYTGVQPGLSLSVTLTDLEERTLYTGWGGIELLRAYVDGEFKTRPIEELLVDEKQGARAVQTALAGLHAR